MEEVETALVGLPRERRDSYGNTQTFEYLVFPTSGAPVARLSRILLTAGGAPGTGELEGEIRYSWILVPGSPNLGRLRSVVALRWTSGESPVAVPVAKVEYLYFDDVDDEEKNDLGVSGDLVQVTKSERVDPSPAPESASSEPVWHRRITQYRYHGGASPISGGARDYTWVGDDHQLKLVIGSQQLEYAAVRSGLGSPSTRLDLTAASLLLLEDDELAVTDESLYLVDLASKVVEAYEPNSLSPEQRVVKEYDQNSCGCGGASGSSQALRYLFDYWSYPSPTPTLWTTRVLEEYLVESSWELNRTTYIDMAQVGPAPSGSGSTTPPSIIRHAVVVDSDEWVTAIQYDSGTGLPERVYMPSNLPSYTPGTISTAPSYTVGTVGLAHEFVYANKRRTQERLLDVVEDDSYLITRTTWGNDSPVPSWLPVKIERFRDETTDTNPTPAADDVEVTEFVYQFHSGTTAISAVQTKSEWDGAAFNGPATEFVYTHEFFDAEGRNIWSRAADGALTRREFAPGSARVTLVERNADDGGSFPSTTGLTGAFTGLNASGGSLTTTTSYDLLGRVQSQVSSAGVTSYVRREMRECGDHPGLEYLALVSLPPELDEDAHAGPVSITWVDASGATMASWQCAVSGEYDLGTGDESWPQAVTDYEIEMTPELLLARSSVARSVSGQMKSTTEWNAPSGAGPGLGRATTEFEYDSLGRLARVQNALGTVTVRVYDAFGRVRKTGVGVDGVVSPLDGLSTINRYVYDGGGVGNGNLTRSIAKLEFEAINAVTEDEEGGDRITDFTYDWRDRLVMTVNPLAPHSAQLHDNLGRVTASATFSELPESVPSDFDDFDDTRVSLQRTTYTQRGLVAKSEVVIEPTEDSGDQDFLATNQWYDEVGRTVGVWAPNSPGRKTTYDGLGRTTVEYITDRGGDTSPGSGSHADIWSVSTRAAVLTGDKVLEQTEYRFITASGPRKGLLDLVKYRERLHDTSATDALGSSTSVTSFRGLFYDAAARTTHSVDYGTNDTTNHRFVSGTSDPTITQGSPPSNGVDALVTQSIYDIRGLATTIVHPGGRIDRTIVDALGRTIATVENEHEVDEENPAVSLSWNGGAENWDVAGASTANDEDRVTTFVHNGIGQLVKMTAIANEDTGNGEDQVTTYVYGVSEVDSPPGEGVNLAPSTIISNNLLKSITYPPGSASTGFLTVYHGYNRQSEIVTTVDQNDTIHTYTRDALGRMTRDLAATELETLDATIDRIDVSFDGAGRLLKVTSLEHDETTPVVRNEVEFGYTPLGQIARVYQDPTSAVAYDGGGIPTNDSDTRLVGYDYENAEIGSDSTGNFSRQSALDYPRKLNSSGQTPETLEYAFGTPGAIDDRISRVKQFKFNLTSGTNTAMANYSYVGMSRAIIVDFDQPDVQLDFTLSLDGKRSTGIGSAKQTVGYYPGFDQFGRLALQTWADGGLTSSFSLPTRPQVVALQYGYDDRGNRTSIYDVRKGNLWDKSHAYTNDGLNRLATARRNTWANLIGGTPSDGVGTQSWDLDLLGNWIGATTKTAISTISESREHNEVNELIERDFAGSSSDHTLGYDAAGNMATDAVTSGATTIYTHDLWNRLVKVEVDDGVTVETRLVQEFNGLTWRTLKKEDLDADGDLDEERTFAYNASWQIIEERVDKDLDSDLDKRVQLVWGLRYIDDSLMHRADLNNDGDYGDTNENTWYHMTDGMFSTVALLDRASRIVERVTYDSYGQAKHHRPYDVDGNGDSGSTDAGIVNGIITSNGGSPVAITNSRYRAEADLNRDGTINSTDATAAGTTASSLAIGLISNAGTGGPDNSIGWDGYAFNPATGDYLVRNRTYRPPIGRWLERDPIVYADGANLFEAVASIPILAIDPNGTDLQVDPTAPSGFRDKVAACLQKLCPGASVDGNGQVHLPNDDAETTSSIVDPPSCPGTDCAKIDCTKPPGCAMLRELVKAGVTIGRLDGQSEDMYRRGTKRVHLSLDRVRLLNRPFDPTTGQFGGGGLIRQNFTACEALWHELTHAWRDARELLHTRNGQPLGDTRLGRAWEEIETIRHVNKELNPWVNCCGGDKTPWVWRDPRGHPLVDDAMKDLYDVPPVDPRGKRLRPPRFLEGPVLTPGDIPDQP